MAASIVWPVCKNRGLVVRRLVMAGNATSRIGHWVYVMATGTSRSAATFIARAVTERTHVK